MTSEAIAATPAPASARRRSRGRFRLAGPSWAWPVLAFLALFFVLPLAANVLRSITGPETVAAGPFVYYVKLLTDAYYAGVLFETFKVAILTTIACLIIGYPVSYFMVRYAGRWNALIVFCLIAPLLTSIIMRTFGWNVLFARRGLMNTWLVQSGLLERPLNILNEPIMVYIGLIHVLVPFMVLSITSVLQGVDVRLEESARILGAGKLSTFVRITLPLSLDGIATGCILVFVLTNGSFLTMLLLGGGKVTTLSLLIYQQFNLTQDVGFAAAMGNVLLVFALICLALQARFVRREGVKA
ncbi:ABC transporter permease [Enterovirga aerilata]|uniref:ABC transporter permease n=1 Tax=Enterovirga aerilata TaxID=2730920 RepID=A0A849IH64_9HYPH|nr:ABC transporter permease [Enterovirga sp. DB1703]NNM75267.1 ABC transporter permease [Enterovirga sp. DB1703]